MADDSTTTSTNAPSAPKASGTTAAGSDSVENTATSGDHDRVAMLSLRADGTPDQTRPEVIVDRDAFLEASKAQFAQQAVSAADVERRGTSSGDVTIVGTEEGKPDETRPADAGEDDAFLSELKSAHQEAQKAGEQSAEAAADSLTK